MKLKGAILDLDGTLLDSMPVWDNLGSDYLRYKGYIPAENLRETLKTMSLVQAAQYFKKEYLITDSESDMIRQFNCLIEHQYRELVPLKAFVKPFLQSLKLNKVKMCLATATDRHLAEAALSRLGVAGYFNGIITCTEAGIGKDNPDFYHRALALLRTPMDETVVFEDALYAVKSAKAAGFRVAGVYDKSAEKDSKAIILESDWYLNSLDEWEMDEK